MVSFTGSTPVGIKIMEAGARTMKRQLQELGGKGACIVTDDADLDKAIDGIASVWAFHSGQICTAPTRVIVHRSRYDELVGRLATAARALKVGDPLDAATQVGPRHLRRPARPDPRPHRDRHEGGRRGRRRRARPGDGLGLLRRAPRCSPAATTR